MRSRRSASSSREQPRFFYRVFFLSLSFSCLFFTSCSVLRSAHTDRHTRVRDLVLSHVRIRIDPWYIHVIYSTYVLYIRVQYSSTMYMCILPARCTRPALVFISHLLRTESTKDTIFRRLDRIWMTLLLCRRWGGSVGHVSGTSHITHIHRQTGAACCGTAGVFFLVGEAVE